MGDTEGKVEYTPEELEEIQRIISIVTAVEEPPVHHEARTLPSDDSDQDVDDGDFDLDIPGVDSYEEDAGETVPRKAARDEDLYSLPEGMDIDITDIQPVEHPDDMEPLSMDSGMSGIKDEGIDEIESREIEDISDLIQVVQEPEDREKDGDISLDDAFLEPAGEFNEEPVSAGLDDEFKIDDFDETLADEIIETKPEKGKPPIRKKSSLDQLHDLTGEEPDSIDVQDLSDEEYVGGRVTPRDTFEDIDLALPGDEPAGMSKKEKAGREVTLDRDADLDIPDLSGVSIEDADIPEVVESDISDLRLDDIGGAEDTKADELSLDHLDDMPSMDIQEMDSGITAKSRLAGKKPLDDIESIDLDFDDNDKPSVEKKGRKPAADLDEAMTIEPLDDDEEAPVKGASSKGGRGDEGVELSGSELKKLKKAIQLFNPAIIKAVKETVINDLLQPNELKQLIDMIMSGKSEQNVHRFLEKKLGRTIRLADETGVPGRRTLTSRPEYTKEGRDRQKKLLKLTRVIGIAAFSAFVISILSYQFIYKPVMARKKINEGASIILSAGDYAKKEKDFQRSEEIFTYVNDNYSKDYLYGYNSYGRAYFDKGEYERSLGKLDAAYKLNRIHADTLNNLGYYYSRVPAEFYMAVKNKVNEKYFEGKKMAEADKSQLNVAINLYKRALLIEKENVTALYGIGNAYFSQGEYISAKKYYEDILAVKKDSIIGYSGLMNLYVERDSFSEVATLFNIIHRKEIMHELPSALLGKLADYFLSKKKKAGSNVRIEYGVRSSNIRDIGDNIYPAVNSTLKALNKRDPDYPPLQIYYAVLNRMQNNLAVTKRHLEKGVELSPNYFDALHLLGEYYYETREPSKAFEYLTRAINSHNLKPEFARDDFYRQRAALGNTYMLLGNIFYYFFDKVKPTYGSLKDELIESNMDKLQNMGIARDKYEMAVNEKYSSPELHYNLGRIYYLNNLYEKSLDQWLRLYDDFVRRPELMFALGNAFYHLGNYQAGKGEFLKLINVLEYDGEKTRIADAGRQEHIRLFTSLSSAYNNLGAIYQHENNEAKSSICYWKSIEYARRLQSENQFARVNLARQFKSDRRVEPIIDESIPYSIDIFRPEMR